MKKSMSLDVGVIGDFAGSAVSHQFAKGPETYLVVLHKDMTVAVHSTSDPASMVVAKTITTNVERFVGWKHLQSKNEVDLFVSKVKLIHEIKAANKPDSNLLPVADDVTPPTTHYSEAMADNATIGVANMMATEDANASDTAAAVADEEEKAESKAVPPSKTATTQANTGKPVPYSFSQPQQYDLSAMTFKFGANGGTSGAPCGIVITSAHAFPHKSRPYSVAPQHLKKINSNVWHLDATYLKDGMDQFSAAFIESKGMEKPMFMDTLTNRSIVDPNHPNEYKKTKGGYVTSKIEWCIQIPNGFNIDLVANQAAETISSMFKTTVANCGENYANWLAANKSGAYNTDTGETGKKKKITHDEFCKQMQLKLVNGFSKRSIEFNTPLDTWMTYYDIKLFLIEKCGYPTWNDVPVTERKYVIGQYPRKTFPDWATVTQPEY